MSEQPRSHTMPPADTRLRRAVRELRRRHGWTQEQLAAELGISRASVALIETGRMRYFPEPLRRLAALLSQSELVAALQEEVMQAASEMAEAQEERLERLDEVTQPGQAGEPAY